MDALATLPNKKKQRRVERRLWPRRRVDEFGVISFGKKNMVAHRCIVIDCHLYGARLKTDKRSDMPAEFYLYIPGLSIRRRAKVCWQRGREMGVQFV